MFGVRRKQPWFPFPCHLAGDAPSQSPIKVMVTTLLHPTEHLLKRSPTTAFIPRKHDLRECQSLSTAVCQAVTATSSDRGGPAASRHLYVSTNYVKRQTFRELYPLYPTLDVSRTTTTMEPLHSAKLLSSQTVSRPRLFYSQQELLQPPVGGKVGCPSPRLQPRPTAVLTGPRRPKTTG